MEASKSIEEWMASEMILTEPLRIPAITLSRIKKELEKTDNRATCVFWLIIAGIVPY
jgi:hypothetical protein